MRSTSDTLGASLARQKWVVLATILLTMLGAFGVRYLLPPAYQAQARVMVDAAHYTAPALLTEAEMLRSSELAAQTINDLGLQHDAEFKGVTAPRGKFLSLSLGKTEVPAAVLEEFQRRLTVQPITGSYVLQLSFISADPQKAALIANRLAALYVAQRQNEAIALPADITLLKTQLQEAEQALANLQQAAPWMDEKAALETQQTELSKRYGPKHPRMVELGAQIKALDEKIATAPSPAARLQDVQQQVAKNRAALDTVLASQKRGSAGESAKLVSPATTPAAPLRSVPSWSYGAAAFIGLFLGLLLAVINEKLDHKIGTLRNFESLTGQSCAGPIPLRDGSGLAGANYVLQKPAAATADAVRTLRASLKLLGDKEGRPLKIITVTSAQDSEERARLAIWLGRLAARADEKVLLIDADLRQPRIHTLLDHSNTPSLVDYLTGQTHLEQIVWKKDPSGMHVVFASAVPNTAPDLIGSVKMTKLMGYLRQGYDLVIMCAPGCLSSADASLLANESDHTLFVADTKLTDRVDLQRGLKVFSGFGYTSLTPVLTDSKA